MYDKREFVQTYRGTERRGTGAVEEQLHFSRSLPPLVAWTRSVTIARG
jgi:hypothetical protein